MHTLPTDAHAKHGGASRDPTRERSRLGGDPNASFRVGDPGPDPPCVCRANASRAAETVFSEIARL
jgi:hypothetical protein